MEPQGRKISVFKQTRVKAAHNYHERTLSVDKVIENVRGNIQLAEKTAIARTLSGADYTRYKTEELPVVTPAMRLHDGQRWQSDGGWVHSGIVPLDYDHVGDAQALADARAAAMAVQVTGPKPHTITAWVSPGGDGLKVWVHVGFPLPKNELDEDGKQIPGTGNAQHGLIYDVVKDVYDAALGLRSDDGRDVTRFCILASDPEALYAPEGDTYALLWRQLR